MSIATSALRRRHARRTGDRPITSRHAAVAIIILSVSTIALGSPGHIARGTLEPVDVLVIGAGISGLSAALEAARGGASVLVVDMSTVGGGHAILSNGAVCIVDTPLQQRQKIADSADARPEGFSCTRRRQRRRLGCCLRARLTGMAV